MSLRTGIVNFTLIALLLIGPVVARADTATTTTPSVETRVQQLLAEIASLRQQVALLLGQRATSTTDTASSTRVTLHPCLILNTTLQLGVQNTDVQALQTFLAEDPSLYNGQVTGYFGPLTRDAVIRFQQKYHIATSTDGTVGSLTRAFLRSGCVASVVPQSPDEPARVATSSSFLPHSVTNIIHWFTDHPATSTAIHTPTILAFSGPTSLSVNTQGTWHVYAADAATNTASSTLSFAVDWGDASSTTNTADALASIAHVVTSTTVGFETLQHTYTAPGSYTITVTVTDTANLSAQATVSVSVVTASVVGDSPTACPMIAVVCPTGQHDVIGTDCTHSCVSNTTPVVPETNTSCTTPWGTTVVSGQTATGFCPDYNDFVGGGVCGMTKSCQNGSWVTATTGSSCPYNRQTYLNGTTMSLDVTKIPGYVGTQADGRVATGVMCVNCGGTLPQYQCRNGDWYKITGSVDFPNMVAAKPVIYLYPTTTEHVTVQLKYKGDLTSTYPTYDTGIQGWHVIAHPDGTLVNLGDNKEYSYLFWEGTYPLTIDQSKGFVIKGSDTKDFLQTTLAKMGMTPKEYNEFIVYWLPKMEHNPYNFIQFVGDAYTQSAPLSISPKPDSMLRVFMAWKPLAKPVDMSPQIITPFTRTGFTVVEWGGTELLPDTAPLAQ